VGTFIAKETGDYVSLARILKDNGIKNREHIEVRVEDGVWEIPNLQRGRS
jgi:hypothetical protein